MSDTRVKVESLGADNYGSWSVRMKLLLKSKELWDVVVYGAIPTRDATALQRQQLTKKDDQALTTIGLHVADQHLSLVDASKSAKELWDKLEGMYRARSTARRQQLRRALMSMKKTATETLTEYFGRARALRDDLIGIGLKVEEDTVVGAVLAGLPEEYDVTVEILETSEQELTLDSIFSKLLQTEQRQHEKVVESDSAQALMVTERRKKHGPKRGDECFYCGKKGHKQAQCYKRKRDLQATAGKPGTSGTALAAMRNEKSSGAGVMEWILDSGATHHMTNSREAFVSYKKALTTIRIGDGRELAVVGEGSVEMYTRVDGRDEKIILEDALHVPELTTNLLSATRMIEHGASVSLRKDKSVVSKTGRDLIWATQDRNLYKVRATVKARPQSHIAEKKASAEIWHRRLGHLGYDNLIKMQKQGMVHGLDVNVDDFKREAEKLCEVCVLSKQHRLPHPRSDSASTRPLELIHMDVNGPMQVRSFGGALYVATYLDDYSRLSHVRLVKAKSDVPTATKDAIIFLENQANAKVKAVRSDRGGEYVNKALKDFYKRKGIDQQLTAPWNPQQNGAAERLNRTLMEKVRAMLLEAELPRELWAEAVNTANFIRNRSPVANSRDKTPWEMFYGVKPDVSMLRTFGATTFAMVPDHKRKKLDPRSEKGILVGYDSTAAYRIWVPETSKVLIRKDVICDEVMDLHEEFEELDVRDETTEPNDATNEPEVEATVDDRVAEGDDQARYDDTQDHEPRYPKRNRMPPTEWYRCKASAHLAAETEPTTVSSALSSKEGDEWRTATAKTLYLGQPKYARDLVHKFGLKDAKSTKVPMMSSVKLTKEGTPAGDDCLFRAALGGLLYLAVCTRPDIMYAVGALARYTSAPTEDHWTALKHVLRYVHGSEGYGINFGGGAPLIGYCDSDYAGDADTRRSTTGYVYLLNGGAISWNSKLQPTVAASSCEAEYMAAAAATKEALWLRKLLQDLGMGCQTVKILGDNQGALKLLKHPIAHARSKHIDVMHHIARERANRGEIEFEYCATDEMMADAFTKALPGTKFDTCRLGIGVRE